MIVPLSWLGEMVEIRGTPQAVCDALTGGGIESEIVEDARPRWDGVVTARLASVERHPDADKLTVTRPTDGETEWHVVCGATNHKVGDVIALATVGTVLPGDFKIKKSKIRGQVSEGMLCSEKELGLSDEAAGILILPSDTPLGVPLSDVISVGDVIIDASAEANRGDCLSVVGLARELAAVTGWPLRGRGATVESETDGFESLDTLAMVSPVAGLKADVAGRGDLKVRVVIEAQDGCPRYAGAIMTGVTIKPSPSWMQRRLEAAGVRPISNVVDCTNYVMIELGNPLHAFDRRFVRGGQIVVRRAVAGEQVTTLDGSEHTLVSGDLVIADGEGFVALAGVMGGQNSEVRDDTTTLFLESAHFEPGTVRRTAHRCKLGTESSYRFARGVDPELPAVALQRLVELLERTSGGRLDGGLIDIYPAPTVRPTVTCRLSRIQGLLGLSLSRSRAIELVERVGLHVVDEGAGTITVRPPSYRFDVEREVDVLEEIARLEGYDAIPEVRPARPLKAVPRQPAGVDKAVVRSALVAQGLSEAIHFSFIDPSWIADLGVPDDHPWRAAAVRVSNPLSEVGGVLRPTLLPSLLRAASRNRAMGAQDIRLFELRTVFSMRAAGFAEILAGRDGRPLDRTPAIERPALCGLLIGRRSAPGWAADDSAVDFYDLRAATSAVERVQGWRGWSWKAEGIPEFLDEREAAVLVRRGSDRPAGWMGRIAVPVLRRFDLDVVVYAFELDLQALAPKKPQTPAFVPFSRFPGSERDLAFVVPDAITAEWLLQTSQKVVRKGMKNAFEGVEVFDVYRGKGIPDGTRSVALRFRFRALDRTLEDRAVDAAMDKVCRAITATEGVVLRG